MESVGLIGLAFLIYVAVVFVVLKRLRDGVDYLVKKEKLSFRRYL